MRSAIELTDDSSRLIVRTMNNVVPLRPEFAPKHYLPEISYTTLQQQKWAMRIRYNLIEAHPKMRFAVHVQESRVLILLHDFPQPLFIDRPTTAQFLSRAKSFNPGRYLHPEYKELRDDISRIVRACCPLEPWVEAEGQVVKRNVSD
jgi:hypothetical protein